jgi:hypothetical protein
VVLWSVETFAPHLSQYVLVNNMVNKSESVKSPSLRGFKKQER